MVRRLGLGKNNRLTYASLALNPQFAIFLKPLFRGNLDPFVNSANLGAIAHTSNGT